MNEEKQIEELAKDMCAACRIAVATECKETVCEGVREHAKQLYKMNYRKPRKYFSPEDVRRMTAKDVAENYTDIMESMKEWK